MKKINYLLILSVFVLSCKTEQKSPKTTSDTTVKESTSLVETYNYDGLAPLLHKEDDTIYVVNFWATWCAPCVAELPEFEKLYANYKDKNVEVLLVSLDFPKQVEKRLIPFIKENNLQAKVVLLNDNDEQRYIDAIDKNWSGSLPATLIYSKNKRAFFEQSFDYETLENKVKTFLN